MLAGSPRWALLACTVGTADFPCSSVQRGVDKVSVRLVVPPEEVSPRGGWLVARRCQDAVLVNAALWKARD